MKETIRNGCDIDSEKIIHIVTGGRMNVTPKEAA